MIRSACTQRHWPRLANVALGATVLADHSRGTHPSAIVLRCLGLMDLVDYFPHTNIASARLLNMWSSTRRTSTATPADTPARSSRGFGAGVGRSVAAGDYGAKVAEVHDHFRVEYLGYLSTFGWEEEQPSTAAHSSLPLPCSHDLVIPIVALPYVFTPALHPPDHSLSVASALTVTHGPPPPPSH